MKSTVSKEVQSERVKRNLYKQIERQQNFLKHRQQLCKEVTDRIKKLQDKLTEVYEREAAEDGG